tara:strand:- start:1399 stop:1833 length:435 start_codon:yes stop_codon:yes gene_type:complete
VDIELAKGILAESGLERDEFAKLCGVKPVSMRMTFYNGRFSKKALALLEDLAEQNREKARVAERVSVKEGMIKQSADLPIERIGMVYMVPRNPYLRMVEFSDGSHGKFRAQPGRFLLGAKVKLRKAKGDFWELCGKYDRKDRLV